MKLIWILMTLTMLLMQIGCSTQSRRDPAYAAVRPLPVEIQENHDGAIFDARTNISLFEDYRAHRVGDILTVTLQEQTDAQKDSETSINKSNSNTISNPTVLGSKPQFDLPKIFPLASTNNNTLAISTDSSSTFKGGGDSDQNNKLTGNITVSVVEVLSNGNLLVRGEKVISINQGNEYIRLSGMINPRDIDADNTISSIKVADAQISYVGDGATHDANVVGWLSRFFISGLMPF